MTLLYDHVPTLSDPFDSPAGKDVADKDRAEHRKVSTHLLQYSRHRSKQVL